MDSQSESTRSRRTPYPPTEPPAHQGISVTNLRLSPPICKRPLCSSNSVQPAVRHLKTFDGEICALPKRIGHCWVQTLSSAPPLATYDLSELSNIRELSRVTFDDKQAPHWIAVDETNRRIILNSGECAEHRLFMVNFDPENGKLTLDARFHDPGSDKPRVSMDGKTWPNSFKGDAYPLGTVFSRSTPAANPAVTASK